MDEILGVLDHAATKQRAQNVGSDIYVQTRSFDETLRSLLGAWPFSPEGKAQIFAAVSGEDVEKRLFLRRLVTELEKGARSSRDRDENEHRVRLWRAEWLEKFDVRREIEAANEILDALVTELQDIRPPEEEESHQWIPFFD